MSLLSSCLAGYLTSPPLLQYIIMPSRALSYLSSPCGTTLWYRCVLCVMRALQGDDLKRGLQKLAASERPQPSIWMSAWMWVASLVRCTTSNWPVPQPGSSAPELTQPMLPKDSVAVQVIYSQ